MDKQRDTDSAQSLTLELLVISAGNSPFPGGTARYYVGDPCYVFPEGEWPALCGILFPDAGPEPLPERTDVGVFRYRGVPFVFMNTAYGDGEYPLRRDGRKVGSFGVDAGCFAIVPWTLIEQWGATGAAEELGLTLTDDLGGATLRATGPGCLRVRGGNAWDIVTEFEGC